MKLSIITINLNHATGLSRTIRSVAEQTWTDYEFIIIDGGSSDGSTGHILEAGDHVTDWVSEPDRGVFDAMNKGIARSRGQYLLMLNSGDTLHDPDVLKKVFADETITEDILYGNVLRESLGTVIGESTFPKELTFNFFRNGSLSHQAAFIRRTVHDTAGLYDDTLKYSADWKLFILAICKHNLTYRHLPELVAVCNCDGLTCDPANFPGMRSEMERTLHRHFPVFMADYEKLDSLTAKTWRASLSRYRARARSFARFVIRNGIRETLLQGKHPN
ncbi:MAG TPA: glycosyltransferase family 2 protein [Sphingobacteriaceae bacterium]